MPNPNLKSVPPVPYYTPRILSPEETLAAWRAAKSIEKCTVALTGEVSKEVFETHFSKRKAPEGSQKSWAATHNNMAPNRTSQHTKGDEIAAMLEKDPDFLVSGMLLFAGKNVVLAGSGESIAGQAVDFQNRCGGIELFFSKPENYGKIIRIVFQMGLSQDQVNAIDRGSARTTSNVLHIQGFSDAVTKGAVGLLSCYGRPGIRNTKNIVPIVERMTAAWEHEFAVAWDLLNGFCYPSRSIYGVVVGSLIRCQGSTSAAHRRAILKRLEASLTTKGRFPAKSSAEFKALERDLFGRSEATEGFLDGDIKSLESMIDSVIGDTKRKSVKNKKRRIHGRVEQKLAARSSSSRRRE